MNYVLIIELVIYIAIHRGNIDQLNINPYDYNDMFIDAFETF